MSVSSTLKPLACGMTIATLVLFPLVNALADDAGYWLHWRARDTVETFGAWCILAAIVFATTRVAALFERPWPSEVVHAAWLLVGGFFFTGALVKTSAIGQFAARHRSASQWIAVALVGLFVACAAFALSRSRRQRGTPLRQATLTLSPLIVVFLFQLGNAQWQHREPRPRHAQAAGAGEAAPAPAKTRPRTLILLFDELSPDYLYGLQAATLDRLPALRQLVARSTRFPGAYLPGGETRRAIPALFQSTRSQGQAGPRHETMALEGQAGAGWLDLALAQGLDVRVLGWHLDYCTGIAAAASECRSISLYNARTLGGGFSFLHPLWTTMNLLPADPPFGWLKEGPAVAMHRRTYAEAEVWMRAQLDDDRADAIYVHVNVPHVPFIAEGFVGHQRFTVTADRYLRQLQFVDAFVDAATRAIAAIEERQARPTVLVVVSDHNVRALTPLADHERIVFLLRRPGSTAPARDDRRIDAADLLSDVIAAPQ